MAYGGPFRAADLFGCAEIGCVCCSRRGLDFGTPPYQSNPDVHAAPVQMQALAAFAV